MSVRFEVLFVVMLAACPGVHDGGPLDAGSSVDAGADIDAGVEDADAGCPAVDAGITECTFEGDCDAMRVDFLGRLAELIEVRRGCTTDDDCVGIEPALICEDGFVFARRCQTGVRKTALCSYQQVEAALAEEACGVCARAGCTEDDRVTGECSGGTTPLCIDRICVQ